MAREVKPMSDGELKLLATLVGESMPLSEDKKYALAMYYQAAELALLNRRYPFGYTEEMAEEAVVKYAEDIEKAFVDKWNRIGADNETAHAEGGVSRNYLSFERYFVDVVPVCKVI